MSGLREKPYINPYLGGTILGVVLFLAFLLTGGGLGASGAVNRVQLAVVDLVAPCHVDQTAYFAQTAGGDRNPLDNPSVLMLAGTVLGGLLSGFVFGRVKPEIRKGPNISNGTRLFLALAGGLIMGYGARLEPSSEVHDTPDNRAQLHVVPRMVVSDALPRCHDKNHRKQQPDDDPVFSNIPLYQLVADR